MFLKASWDILVTMLANGHGWSLNSHMVTYTNCVERCYYGGLTISHSKCQVTALKSVLNSTLPHPSVGFVPGEIFPQKVLVFLTNTVATVFYLVHTDKVGCIMLLGSVLVEDFFSLLSLHYLSSNAR